MLTIVPIGRITATDESRVVISSLIDNRVQTGIRLRRPPRPGRGTTPSSERGTGPRTRGNGFPPGRRMQVAILRYRSCRCVIPAKGLPDTRYGSGNFFRCSRESTPPSGVVEVILVASQLLSRSGGQSPTLRGMVHRQVGGRRLQTCATDRAGPSFPRKACPIRDTGGGFASVIPAKARRRAGSWNSSSLLPGYSPGAGDNPPRYGEWGTARSADAGYKPALPIVPVRHSRECTPPSGVVEFIFVASRLLSRSGGQAPMLRGMGHRQVGGRRLQTCATDHAGPSFSRKACPIRDTGVEISSVIPAKARPLRGRGIHLAVCSGSERGTSPRATRICSRHLEGLASGTGRQAKGPPLPGRVSQK